MKGWSFDSSLETYLIAWSTFTSILIAWFLVVNGCVYKRIRSVTPILCSRIVCGIKMSVKSPSQMEVQGILRWLPLGESLTIWDQALICDRCTCTGTLNSSDDLLHIQQARTCTRSLESIPYRHIGPVQCPGSRLYYIHVGKLIIVDHSIKTKLITKHKIHIIGRFFLHPSACSGTPKCGHDMNQWCKTSS